MELNYLDMIYLVNDDEKRNTHELWGLTHDDNYMYLSEGSDKIYVVDEKFNIIRTLEVKDSEKHFSSLNELELVGNYIYANVFQTNNIVKIDKNDGNVA